MFPRVFQRLPVGSRAGDRESGMEILGLHHPIRTHYCPRTDPGCDRGVHQVRHRANKNGPTRWNSVTETERFPHLVRRHCGVWIAGASKVIGNDVHFACRERFPRQLGGDSIETVT
jgi:hypothetical protein